MLHHVRDVVECRVAVDFVLRRLEQWTAISWVARDDRRRRNYPQAHPFEAPRVGIARVAKRELRVRSMYAANVAMAKAALRTDKHLPKRPIMTGHSHSPSRRPSEGWGPCRREVSNPGRHGCQPALA